MSVEIAVYDWSTTNLMWWLDFETSVTEALEGNWDYFPEYSYSQDDGGFYFPRSTPSTINLYQAGCWRPDKEHYDCSWACQDPASVWNSRNSTYTLHNCVVYPIIVKLAQQGFSFTSKWPHWEHWASYFNIPIGPNTTAPAAVMNTSVISSCLNSFCESAEEDSKPEGCNKPIQAQYFIADKNGRGIISEELPFNTNICQGIDAQINPDIGGIGVFISYLMQIALVVIIWITFHIMHDWTAFGSYLYLKFVKRTSSPWAEAKLNQRDWKEDGKKSPMRDDMLVMIKDFHVTQVFFMLAVQVAALIAIHNPKYLDSNSWQQFYNNVGILYDLAFGGALPVLLTQVLLRQGGQRGWYTLQMSIVSVSLSTATWFRTHLFLQAGSEELQAYIKPESPGLTQCGGIPPTKYCYEADWFFNNAVASTKAIPMIVFCLVVIVAMIVDQIKVFKHRPVKEPAGWKRYHQDGRSVFDLVRANSMGLSKESENEGKRIHWKKPLHVVQRLIVFGTEVGLIALTMILLKDYGRILVPGDLSFKLLDLTAWSFGQVIAVTIWFPVMCKYLWNLFETVTGLDVKRKREKRDEENAGLSKSSTFSEPSKQATITVVERKSLQGRTHIFDSISDSERQ